MINTLVKLIPPPDTSIWHGVETEWKLTFPPDYKDFVHTYGDGAIGNFLTVLNPYSPLTTFNLQHEVRRILEGYTEFQKAWQNEFPYPFYPLENGLFPFASSGDGDTLFWVTSGTPDSWNIAIHYHNVAKTQLIPLTFNAFFAYLFDKTQRTKKDIDIRPVFVESVEVEIPFISVRKIMDEKWKNLRKAILHGFQDKNTEYLTRIEVYNLFKSQGFILDTILTQEFLQHLQNEKMIELSPNDNKYIKLTI